jgi:hypothetical protein
VRRYVVNTLRRERLVDRLVEAYVDWRETCDRVNDAYRTCASETGPRGRVAFGMYLAELDAEGEAAEVYAEYVRRAGKLKWSEDAPAQPLGGPTRRAGWL